MTPKYRRSDYQRALASNQAQQEGAPGAVPVEYVTDQSGEYRIQNNSAAGYLLFIGVNGPPNFDLPAYSFSPTVPLNVAWPLPGSGIQNLFIVPRLRDTWGCVSQNSHPWIIRLSPTGELLAPLPLPESVRAYPRPNGNINVIGQYPTFAFDRDPADKVRVWVDTVSPPSTAGTATHEGNVTGSPWSVSFGSYGPGTYYVAVAYYRTADGALSSFVYDTVVFPELPDSPQAVFTENITS